MNNEKKQAQQERNIANYFLNIKNIIVGIMLLTALLVFAHVPAYASKDVQIFVVNEQHNQSSLVSGSHVQPFIQGNRLMVPLRSLAENLQSEIGWSPEERAVTVRKNGQVVTLWIGQHHYLIGNQRVAMDIAPIIYHDTTMVPIRFIADALGHDILWDEHARRAFVAAHSHVTINRDQFITAQPQVMASRFNQEDVEWLARIIMAEAEGEPYLGQLAVGAVVLNRVESREFPNSIYGVIFDKWQHYYQFEPVQNGRIHQVRPRAMHYQAAQEVLAGHDPTNGALFFFNPKKSSSAWMRTKPVTLRIGNHVFMM